MTERESLDGEMKLKTPEEGEDEREMRERDVRGGGGSLSSDWLPPLARSRVLRLAAAPERSHTREGGGGATTQPELSPIHTDSSPPHETRC